MRTESAGSAGPFACADCYGYTYIHKFGHNPDIDTATVPEDIWDGPAPVYPFPAAAGAVTVVSASGSDAAAGVGMRTVRVFGLNGSGVEITEDVTLNGLVAVPLANQYLRLHRAQGLTAGTSGTNVGDISFTHAVAGVIAVIQAGDGQTLMAVYTTPSNAQRVAMLGFYASLGRTGATAYVTMQLQSRLLTVADPCWRVREQFELISVGSSVLYWKYPVALRTNAYEDWRLRCIAASANNLEVSGGFDIAYKTP
jgi:hypothetical protein